jgi:hypothetical protein
LVKKLFPSLSIAEGLLQLWSQFCRHIHTAAAAFVGKREEESGVFVAAGAGRAVGPDAGFMDLSERAFDGGPEFFELAEKVLTKRRMGGFRKCHCMYILYNTYNGNNKIETRDGPVSRRH